jgi:hypothetical protein
MYAGCCKIKGAVVVIVVALSVTPILLLLVSGDSSHQSLGDAARVVQ